MNGKIQKVSDNTLIGIIFSHSFCRAFWVIDPDPNFWKYYLQTMVLEENPIKYLEKFL